MAIRIRGRAVLRVGHAIVVVVIVLTVRGSVAVNVREGLVRDAVAVVVQAVADLSGAREHLDQLSGGDATHVLVLVSDTVAVGVQEIGLLFTELDLVRAKARTRGDDRRETRDEAEREPRARNGAVEAETGGQLGHDSLLETHYDLSSPTYEGHFGERNRQPLCTLPR